MPTAWSAGEHDVKMNLKGFSGTLNCKCGWVRELSRDELMTKGEIWRDIADEHKAEFNK